MAGETLWSHAIVNHENITGCSTKELSCSPEPIKTFTYYIHLHFLVIVQAHMADECQGNSDDELIAEFERTSLSFAEHREIYSGMTFVVINQ